MSAHAPEITEKETEERRLRARRQVSDVTVDNVWKLLSKERYWTPEVSALLFGRVERARLVDPEIAWRLGEVLPVLVDKVPWSDFGGDGERVSWTVRVLALCAELADLTGRRHLSDAFLKQALDIDGADTLATAELYRRRAACALRAGLTSDARIFVGNAISHYRKLDGKPGDRAASEKCLGLSEALFLDGIVHDEPLSLAESLQWGEVGVGKNSGAMVFDAAVTAVADRLGRAMTVEQVEGTLAWLDQARKRSFTGVFKSPRKFRILWSEARLLVRLGCGRLAERRFQPIWSHFWGRDDAAPLAVCAVDMAETFLHNEEADKAADILRRTVHHLQFIDADSDLIDRACRAQGMSDSGALRDLRQEIATNHLSGPGRWYPLEAVKPTDPR